MNRLFAILVCVGAALWPEAAEAIRSGVEALRIPHAGSRKGFVTVSVGQATRVDGGYETVVDLVAACDRALYEAKNSGRNRVVVAS